MPIVDSNKIRWGGLPEGTIALFLIQIFSTLSYSVLYSTLVLFLTSKLGLTVKLANSITGVFVATNFALHLLGGYFGGRFLSNRLLFCMGMVAQIIGCILLAGMSVNLLYYGLASFLTGCGLNVTCINYMLTQRFKPKDNRRETAFLWNYAGMNIGFFVGFSLSGYFQLSQNYQSLFLFSSLGNLAALFICLYFWHDLADQNTAYSRLQKDSQRKASLWGITLMLCLPLALNQLLHFASLANKLILFTGSWMLTVVIWLAFQQKTQEAREKMFAFTVLMTVSTVFWTLYTIGPMGLTTFITHNVDRSWLMLTIPPQWFNNINTLCIVLGGPALSLLFRRLRSRGIKVNIPAQFAYALLLIGLAFAILPLGIARADNSGMVDSGWVILSFILQSVGELLLSPIGYAMVGALIPGSLQGIMMGMWMLGSGVGATIASYSSNTMIAGQDTISPLLTNNGYSRVFLNLSLFALAASFILFVLAPKLRAWINEDRQDLVEETKIESSIIAQKH